MEIMIFMIQNHFVLNTLGSRIKYCRNLCDLTLDDISKKFKVTHGILSLWENNKRNPKEKYFLELVQTFQKSGVNVTESWLRDGTGNLPQKINDISNQNLIVRNQNHDLSFIVKIDNEVDFFSTNNTNAVVIQNRGEDMLPYFYPEEYVGGIKTDFSLKLQGQNCIIKIKEKTYPIVRRVHLTEKNKLNLYILNPFRDDNEIPVIYNSEIEWIAKIIWRRLNE